MAAMSVESMKLLKRVAGYYQHCLSADSSGMAYLRDKLQIHHNLVIKDCLVGYSDGSLVKTLPEDPAVLSRLHGMGILDKSGLDKLTDCLVVPLTDAAGEIVNLFAKDLNTHKSWFIKKSVSGILNHRAFMVFDHVVIAPTILDMLVIYDRGIQNCSHIHCAGDIESTRAFFGSKSLTHIFLTRFKASVRNACYKILPSILKETGLAVYPITIPSAGATAYFAKHDQDEFKQLLERGKERFEPSSEKTRTTGVHFERTLDGFLCIAGGVRNYEIKGVDKRATQLKITLKASLNQQGQIPFELSTVDMYSYRARMWFARLCADLFVVSEDVVQADLHCILDYAEKMEPAENGSCIQISNMDRDEALKLLKDPQLMDRILDDFESLGVVGEQTNKMVGYVAAVSRKLDEPLSVLIQSRSAAGKSTLQDGIIALLPPEDVLKYTRITDQALFYSGENTFAHKVLAIEEGPGMKGAAYSIRNIQSSGKITIAAAGKSAGQAGLKTSSYTVKGPVAVMLTTTATNLDEETASRFIVLTIDESARMTRAIHEHHRRGEALNGVISRRVARQIAHKHHNAQRLLKPLLVINPYALHLSYPSAFLKARRDFRKYLGLIKAIAFLHQYQRELKSASIDGRDFEYIEVALSDIEHANTLAAEVLGHSLDDLPVSSRQLLQLIYKMVSALASDRGLPIAKISITRRMIREYTGWSNWQVRNYLPPLLDFEYLIVQPQSRVNRYSFAVNTGESSGNVNRSGLQLTSVSEIKRKVGDAGSRE